jgi:hypothetical protein
MKAFFVIVLLVLLIVIGPLLALWSLNTLFPVLAIPYNIYTWAAVGILSSYIRARFPKSVN